MYNIHKTSFYTTATNKVGESETTQWRNDIPRNSQWNNNILRSSQWNNNILKSSQWNNNILRSSQWNNNILRSSQWNNNILRSSQWNNYILRSSQWNNNILRSSQWNNNILRSSQWNNNILRSSQWNNNIPRSSQLEPMGQKQKCHMEHKQLMQQTQTAKTLGKRHWPISNNNNEPSIFRIHSQSICTKAAHRILSGFRKSSLLWKRPAELKASFSTPLISWCCKWKKNQHCHNMDSHSSWLFNVDDVGFWPLGNVMAIWHGHTQWWLPKMDVPRIRLPHVDTTMP